MTTYRPGADLWLLFVAVVALIGYVVLAVTGNGHDDRLLGLVYAALAAGAGVAAPRGITRALDAVTGLNAMLQSAVSTQSAQGAQVPPAPAADPAATVPVAPVPAVPPFADQP